jgi:hypothetical protein
MIQQAIADIRDAILDDIRNDLDEDAALALATHIYYHLVEAGYPMENKEAEEG